MTSLTASAQRIPPEVAFVAGGLSQYVGASVAVGLFDDIAPGGVALLRVSFAAAVIVLLRRSWKRRLSGPQLAYTAAFGAALAAMNLCIYLAMARLPLGNAVAIEFTGPILVAVLGVRSLRAVGAVALAAVGVLVLSGVEAEATLAGTAFALGAGACWAGYIVLGHQVARRGISIDGLGIAMTIGALVIAPFGAGELPTAFASPSLLVLAAATGLASNVIPYGIDQLVMRRVSRAHFALLQAILPATATLTALVLLGQTPSWIDLVGIAAITAAIATANAR